VASLLARAHARHSAGHVADALQLYAEALQRDALHVEARLFLGIAYVKSGDYEEAAQALRAALFLVPDLWPAAFYLALAYEKLGRADDAVREYRRLIDVADSPLGISGPAMAELEDWKPDVLQLARRRAGEVRS
jgi:tetratricopeptide (TPR) repeat protein